MCQDDSLDPNEYLRFGMIVFHIGHLVAIANPRWPETKTNFIDKS